MARKLVLVEMKKHLISKSRMQDIAAALEVSKHVRVGDRFYISPEVCMSKPFSYLVRISNVALE